MTLDSRSVVPTCLLLMLGLSHAQSHAQAAPDPELLTMYRTMDCAMLRNSDRTMDEDFRQGDALQPTPQGVPRFDRHLPAIRAEWEQKKLGMRAALTQALREKQCDKPQAAALPADRSRQATRAPVPGAPVAARVQPQMGARADAGLLPEIGIRADAVSSGFAQSLGFRQAHGALVVEVEAGSTADKAGLRALDIVVEITGQTVQGPDDLRDTLSRMRPGFRAPLRIWRDRAERELLVVIGAAPPVQQAAMPAVTLPDRVLPASAPPAGPARFCYAFLVQIGKPVGAQSSVWEERGPDFGHAALLKSMAGFTAHMRQLQPGVWHDDFPAGKCFLNSQDTQCVASSLRTFGTSQQINQFCHETREKAETGRKPRGPGLPVIEWTPPAAP